MYKLLLWCCWLFIELCPLIFLPGNLKYCIVVLVESIRGFKQIYDAQLQLNKSSANNQVPFHVIEIAKPLHSSDLILLLQVFFKIKMTADLTL